jgi:peroxiredoxin
VRLKHRANRTSGLCLWVYCGLHLGAATAASPGIVAQRAPDFALPAAVGDNVRLSEFLGQPVVLAFWSSRCSTCAAQLAALDRYYATYRSSGLVVLAVSVEDDPQRAVQYARAHPTSYPLLLDQAKAVGRAYEIERLPTTVLIDRSGVVRYLHSDDRPGDASYVAQIRALLDDKVGTP